MTTPSMTTPSLDSLRRFAECNVWLPPNSREKLMTHQITVNTYLELNAGPATLIEDVPVELTIRGENDGFDDLHWWIDKIKAEFIGNDLTLSCREAIAPEQRYPRLETRIMRQLYKAAEEDEGVHGEIADQLKPLVLGRAA